MTVTDYKKQLREELNCEIQVVTQLTEKVSFGTYGIETCNLYRPGKGYLTILVLEYKRVKNDDDFTLINVYNRLTGNNAKEDAENIIKIKKL